MPILGSYRKGTPKSLRVRLSSLFKQSNEVDPHYGLSFIIQDFPYIPISLCGVVTWTVLQFLNIYGTSTGNHFPFSIGIVFRTTTWHVLHWFC